MRNVKLNKKETELVNKFFKDGELYYASGCQQSVFKDGEGDFDFDVEDMGIKNIKSYKDLIGKYTLFFKENVIESAEGEPTILDVEAQDDGQTLGITLSIGTIKHELGPLAVGPFTMLIKK